jgi:hypothetical protein
MEKAGRNTRWSWGPREPQLVAQELHQHGTLIVKERSGGQSSPIAFSFPPPFNLACQ